MKAFLLFVLTTICCSTFLTAQGIKGRVTNTDQEPLPFVNIFIRTLETGTTTDGEGYFFLTIDPGQYEVFFSSLGYKSQNQLVVVDDKITTLDVELEPNNLELNEVVVKASKKNPAYEIIRKVIKQRDKYLKGAKSYKCEVYIKATEKLLKKDKPNSKKSGASVVSVGLEGESVDRFDNAAQEADKRSDLNLVEIELTLNYQAPNSYKEERTAYKAYGRKDGLFIPNFSTNDFNIYANLIPMKDLADAPVISPLNKTAILSYKYKLESAEEENGQLVYKIKVSPRKSGNSTLSGYLYINDGLWNVNRFVLNFPKSGLKIYDVFQLTQAYQPGPDSLWLINKQVFNYQEKKGRYQTFKGRTTVSYSNRQLDYPFPNRFFNNEVVTTTQEAYERDSSYWADLRPEALNQEESEMIEYRDSIYAVLNDPLYLDSVDRAFNKVKLGEILFHGVGFRNFVKKKEWYISSIPGMIEFEIIGGFRVALPYLTYFKKWKNERFLYTGGSVSVGLQNGDLQGYGSLHYRYDPFHEGYLTFRGGRTFYSINPDDAYLNQLKTSNFILNDRIDIYHSRELFNGFYVQASFDYSIRQSIRNFDSKTFINRIIDDDSEGIAFEDYNALITEFRLAYTPMQRYMREPYRKVVLGSDFPTFSVAYKKGWNRLLGSAIDFDYVEAEISQNIVFGMLGQSKYSAKAGRFINTKDLRYVDLKRFRQSDPYLYSDPRSTFQLLDTSLISTGFFFEFHHIHHFNGALVNNIPLLKKTKIRAVAGAGMLWVQADNYRHEEIFAGIERVFKIGPRRRMRIGIFGVVANSNRTGLNNGFKISFDIIDTWKRDWSY